MDEKNQSKIDYNKLTNLFLLVEDLHVAVVDLVAGLIFLLLVFLMIMKLLMLLLLLMLMLLYLLLG
jgi:hypothetical protein